MEGWRDGGMDLLYSVYTLWCQFLQCGLDLEARTLRSFSYTSLNPFPIIFRRGLVSIW